MTTLWAGFYDYILPDLPGAQTAAVDIALRQAAIAFCEQSLAWKYTHPDIAVVTVTDTYSYVPPSGAVVHAVTYAAFDGTEIQCRAGEQDILIVDWRNATGTPEYVLGGATALTLVPAPDVAGTLSMEVVLKPSPTATGIDDSIFNEYRQAIIHGALARLMLSPRKPYTSATLAQYHSQQFTILSGQAGLRQARNFTRAPLRTSIMKRG